jgi:hypothetical protein
VGENAYGDGVWAYAPPQDDGGGGSNGSVALSAGALALLEGEVGSSSSSSSSAAPAANPRNARLAATAAVPQGPRARLTKLNLLENNLTAEQALVSGGSTPSLPFDSSPLHSSLPYSCDPIICMIHYLARSVYIHLVRSHCFCRSFFQLR